MKLARNLFLLALVSLVTLTGCKKDEPEPEPQVFGCMDANAINYNPDATVDNGTCTYPDVFFPLTVGNKWEFEDEVTVLTFNVTVKGTIEVIRDTSFNNQSYTVVTETYEAEGGTFPLPAQETRYAYRQATSGQYYRIELDDSTLEERLILEYPVEVGKSWYDNTAQNGQFCEILTKSTVTVPAGTFPDVFEVKYTDQDTQFESFLYFSQNNGLVKVKAAFGFQGFNVDIEADLVAYTLN